MLDMRPAAAAPQKHGNRRPRRQTAAVSVRLRLQLSDPLFPILLFYLPFLR